MQSTAKKYFLYVQHPRHLIGEIRDDNPHLAQMLSTDMECEERLVALGRSPTSCGPDKKDDYQGEVSDEETAISGPSPIQKLPDEILLEVFRLLGGWNTVMSGADRRRPHIAGQKLEHVCLRWRRLASSCLELWTKIHLVFSREHSNHHWKYATSLLSYILARSGNHPIDISFFANWSYLELLHPAIKLLWSTTARWRSLRIAENITSMGLVQRGQQHVPYHLPLLEEGHFSVLYHTQVALLRASPRLRRVYMSLACWPVLADPNTQTFSQITQVHLRSVKLPFILNTLPRVEIIVLQLNDDSFSTLLLDTIFLPTSCRSLFLDAISSGHTLARHLQYLRAPSIKHLRLRGLLAQVGQKREYNFPPVKELTDFVERSGCRLSSFFMEDFMIRRDHVQDLVGILGIKNAHSRCRDLTKDAVNQVLVWEGSGEVAYSEEPNSC